jgi:nucleotide-binding universal stress UspA family protein
MAPYSPPLAGGEYLEEIASWAFPDSIEVDRLVEGGAPAATILERSRNDRGTLICMATHGRSGITRWMLGSVAYKVLHAAHSPVLLIRPVEETDPLVSVQIKTLLAPLDGSGLAEQILPHVNALAAKLRLSVNLLRAYTFPPDAYLVGDGLYMEPLSRYREAVAQDVEKYLADKAELVRSAGLSRVEALAVSGNAAQEIISFADRTPNCMIAMSTHGKTGLDAWYVGSVAEKIVHRSTKPVLLVRPE